MTVDISRWPIRPDDYAGVLLQQGRVLTDADWNEQYLLADRRERIENIDTLGRAVVPWATKDAFKISVAGSIKIGVGRAYLDGLLIENHGVGTLDFDSVLAELVGSGTTDYPAQPWQPNAPANLPTPYVAYLKAWRRERSWIEAPDLVEPALGVDTTGRLQTVWQVKLAAAAPGTDCSTPLDQQPAFVAAEPAAGGRLTTGTAVIAGQPDPCTTPDGGGYTGRENQTYRVEIHDGGVVGGASGATFKWSRENATVAARVTQIGNTRDWIVVDQIGRDDFLAFHDGDWVEITDDDHDLSGIPGEMHRIVTGNGVNKATRTIKLESQITAGAFHADPNGVTVAAKNTRVRRWDQSGKVYSAGGATLTDLSGNASPGVIKVPSAAVSVLLEEGIVVTFKLVGAAQGARLRPGDHWIFVARSEGATVEILNEAPPRAVHAHYAPLAYVTAAGVTDCRVVAVPLGELVTLSYVAGDGQEATPSYLVPADVDLTVDPTVRVARGPLSLENRVVRFTLLDGLGHLGRAGTAIAPTPGPIDVSTNPQGLAAVPWSLGAGNPVGAGPAAQRLDAVLLDDQGQPTDQRVTFSARLRTASEVAYDPSKCGGAGGPGTVQAALDLLCARDSGGGCCVVVKVGDDVIQAIEDARKVDPRRVCLCFMPGDHRIETDGLPELAYLEMHGHGSSLWLDKPLRINGPIENDQRSGQLRISDLAIANNPDAIGFDRLLTLDVWQDVELQSVELDLTAAAEKSVTLSFRRCDAIRLIGSTVANQAGEELFKARTFAREELPVSIGALVDVANKDLPIEEAMPVYEALVAQPMAVRTAEADAAGNLAVERKSVLGARASLDLTRLSNVIREGKTLTADRLKTVLGQAGRLGGIISGETPPPAAVVEFSDVFEDAWLEGNVLPGSVLLSAGGEKTGLEDELASLLVREWIDLKKGAEAAPRFAPGQGHMRLTHNRLARIGIGPELAQDLVNAAGAGSEGTVESSELRAAIHLQGNTITQLQQVIVASTVIMDANRILPGTAGAVGVLMAGAAVVEANIGPSDLTGQVFMGPPPLATLLVAAADRAATNNLRMKVAP